MKLWPSALVLALLPASLAAAQEPPAGPRVQAPTPPDPATWETLQPRMVRHSEPLKRGGAALIVLGLLSGAGAGIAFAMDRFDGDFGGVLSLLVGLPLSIHAAGCIAAGIPMYIVGNRMIPAPPPRSPPPRAWIPSIEVGRSSAALRFTF